MDFISVLDSRYSCRSFADTAIEEAIVNQILEAGRIAPTAGNRQPQRTLVINAPEAVAQLDECTRSRNGAPLCFAICFDMDKTWKREAYDGENSGQVDASIVTTYMMLKATELGLGTLWVMHFNPAKFSETYHLPENIIPVALLMVGHPTAEAAPSPRHEERLPLADTVCFNSFE